MQTLKPEDVVDFLARFSNFYDAILHEFSCKTPGKGKETSCELTFETKDMETESGWSHVTIRVEDVASWKFAASLDCAYFIMSSGVHLRYQDELFYMSVNELDNSSENIGNYLDSDFHFVARAISWTATAME